MEVTAKWRTVAVKQWTERPSLIHINLLVLHLIRFARSRRFLSTVHQITRRHQWNCLNRFVPTVVVVVFDVTVLCTAEPQAYKRLRRFRDVCCCIRRKCFPKNLIRSFNHKRAWKMAELETTIERRLSLTLPPFFPPHPTWLMLPHQCENVIWVETAPSHQREKHHRCLAPATCARFHFDKSPVVYPQTDEMHVN
jgi:hypothetical protein